MRISIALCTWNGAAHLAEQLARLAAQTRLADEPIVCDDASTDHSPEIVQNFARSAPFTVHLRQNPTRLGIMKNFQKAIVQCSGDLIFLCDQDNVWHRDKIAVMLRAFDADDDPAERNVVTGATLAFRDRWRESVLPIPEVPEMLHDQWIATAIAAVADVDCIEDCLIDFRQHAAQQVEAVVAAGPNECATHAAQLEAVLHRLERIAAPVERGEDLFW